MECPASEGTENSHLNTQRGTQKTRRRVLSMEQNETPKSLSSDDLRLNELVLAGREDAKFLNRNFPEILTLMAARIRGAHNRRAKGFDFDEWESEYWLRLTEKIIPAWKPESGAFGPFAYHALANYTTDMVRALKQKRNGVKSWRDASSAVTGEDVNDYADRLADTRTESTEAQVSLTLVHQAIRAVIGSVQADDERYALEMMLLDDADRPTLAEQAEVLGLGRSASKMQSVQKKAMRHLAADERVRELYYH